VAPYSGAILPNRRPVGDGERRDPGAVELDELSHDALPSQDLRHREDEVGRGCALGDLPGEPEADHLRDQHRHRLAKHRGLGFDAADAPAKHPEAVDHRGVGVRADQRVRVRLWCGPGCREHHAGEILEVHLVDDTRVRRHHAEPLKRLLRPTEQRVALAVALELEVGVHLKGRRGAELVDDDRMIDHELGGEERVYGLGVAAHRLHRVAHRGEIHDRRHAGEVLHQHARRHERDLVVGALLRIPARESLDLLGPHGPAVLEPQQVLEQDPQRVGKPGQREPALLERGQAEDLVAPRPDGEPGSRAETVRRRHSTTFTSATKYSVSPKQLVGTPLCWL
jgi:hypothetical protein